MILKLVKKNMNYGTYDLSEIFPFRIYEVQEDDTFEIISKKLDISIEKIKYLNDLSDQFQNSDLKTGMVSLKENNYSRR